MYRDWDAARAAWATELGTTRILTDAAAEPYRHDVGGDQRDVPAVLLPETTEQVQAIVRIARRFHTPVSPISRGRNWGLGSRLPARDGSAVVDLSRMDRIRTIDPTHHYAVVEPGVTQGGLYDALREGKHPLLLNVTGSGRGTSVLGNALDRGVGYFHARAEELSGLEVVLGTGEILRTGFSHDARSRVSHLFRHGVGPSLDGLFFQGNMGIVTAAGVNLIPKPPAHCAVVASVPTEDRLAALVDGFADLGRSGTLRTVVHIGNRERGEITLAPLLYDLLAAEGKIPPDELRAAAEDAVQREGFSAWSAVAGMMGTPGELKAACRALRKRLRGIARVMVLTKPLLHFADQALTRLAPIPWARRKRRALRAILPLFDLTRGIPTDAALKSVFWPIAYPPPPADSLYEPDRGACGLLYSCPVFPAVGAEVAEAMRQTNRIFSEHGFLPYVTVNLLDERAMEGVVSLSFPRHDPLRREAAHACIRAYHDFLNQAGFTPFRMGIAFMDQAVDQIDPYWGTVQALKHTLDPDGILAPGRYGY